MCFHRSLSYERGWCGGSTLSGGVFRYVPQLFVVQVLRSPHLGVLAPLHIFELAMAAAQVFSVNLSADDGGLMALLIKAGVDARVITWLTGGGAADQGIDTLRLFVASFVVADYERDSSTRVKESAIDGITNVPRELNRTIAMLRAC